MEKWNLIIYAPAYNVEKSIEELIIRIEKIKRQLEKSCVLLRSLIIVNDGSTDDTTPILFRSKKKFYFLDILDKKQNEGPVKALFDAMEKAAKQVKKCGYPPEKTIMIRMDADLEHQPEDIPKLIEPIVLGKTNVSVGFIPFDSRTGLLNRWFNRFFGSNESKRFLGITIPQFCPGFNAIRADIFKKLYPLLEEKNGKFEKAYNGEMLTVDFIILAIAKKSGEEISVTNLTPIEDNWVKKMPISKIFYYLDYHRKTIDFLEKTNQE